MIVSPVKDNLPTDYANEMIGKMKQILDKKYQYDMVLVSTTDGTRIPAHRLMLSAASEYFAEMFKGELKELKLMEIKIDAVAGKALQDVVNYCYSGILDLRVETVASILAAAISLKINSAILCILFFAEEHNCTEIMSRAWDFVCDNFKQIVRTAQFAHLNVDQLGSLLSRDDLNVELEEDIFCSLMSWVQIDEGKRKKHLPQLLPLVRLSLMDSKFLIDHVESVCKDNGCSELIMESYKRKLVPKAFPQSHFKRSKTRQLPSDCLLAFGAFGVSTFDIYCPKRKRWTAMKEMELNRILTGVAVWQDKIVWAGGYSIGEDVSPAQYWDKKSKMWKNMTSLNKRRQGAGVAVLGGSLYVIGGSVGSAYENSVERLDSLTGSWKSVASLPKVDTFVNIVVYKKCIYVEQRKSLYRYDPSQNKWTMLRHTVGNTADLVVIGDNLYGLRHRDVQLYNKEADTWSTYATNCPVYRLCTINDQLCGISRHKNGQAVLKEYKPDTKTWKNVAPLCSIHDVWRCITVPSSLF